MAAGAGDEPALGAVVGGPPEAPDAEDARSDVAEAGSDVGEGADLGGADTPAAPRQEHEGILRLQRLFKTAQQALKAGPRPSVAERDGELQKLREAAKKIIAEEEQKQKTAGKTEAELLILKKAMEEKLKSLQAEFKRADQQSRLSGRVATLRPSVGTPTTEITFSDAPLREGLYETSGIHLTIDAKGGMSIKPTGKGGTISEEEVNAVVRECLKRGYKTAEVTGFTDATRSKIALALQNAGIDVTVHKTAGSPFGGGEPDTKIQLEVDKVREAQQEHKERAGSQLDAAIKQSLEGKDAPEAAASEGEAATTAPQPQLGPPTGQ